MIKLHYRLYDSLYFTTEYYYPKCIWLYLGIPFHWVGFLFPERQPYKDALFFTVIVNIALLFLTSAGFVVNHLSNS